MTNQPHISTIDQLAFSIGSDAELGPDSTLSEIVAAIRKRDEEGAHFWSNATRLRIRVRIRQMLDEIAADNA